MSSMTSSASISSSDTINDNGVWIFGYGSLMWRPSFPFTYKRMAYIEGWKRRYLSYDLHPCIDIHMYTIIDDVLYR